MSRIVNLDLYEDDIPVVRACIAAAVADLLMKIDAHGGMSKVPHAARDHWDALMRIAPVFGLDL